MAVKDLSKHYAGLRVTGPVLPTPNTVSRHLHTGDRSFEAVVGESGKPYLESEVNLGQDASWWENFLFRRWQIPSGWLRGSTRSDVYDNYTLETPPLGVTDDTPGTTAFDGTTMVNALVLPRLEAVVAGRPVVVEYTNTRTTGYNIIPLEAPRIYDGTSNTVKRTDFVFLEVWRALVAPSVRATAYVEVVDASSINVGDVITINGVNLTAGVVDPPPADEFVFVPGDEAATATNIANAVNLVSNSFASMVSAQAYLGRVLLTAVLPGVGAAGAPNTGNFITLTVTCVTPGAMTPSGPLFTGGEDRPCKPATEQDKVYRHGNVLSPSPTWLEDEIIDPELVNTESTQRIQVQYRIRVTGTSEAVNYKTHPEGFSTLIGGPPAPAIFAQGSGNIPVSGVRSYPFVPADNTTTWLESSAPAYGMEDDGLWVAGDGSEQAAEDLGTIDGFVYAIPLCMVFRHNNASDLTASVQGFDPLNNMNGAPTHDHGGYVGVLGTIAAGRSDRPDGEFCDVITQNNILDLRRQVTFPGVEFSSELLYQIQSVLDGSLRTWAVDSASKYPTMGNGSGDVSTRFLVCNEVGRASPEGTPDVSGTTTRGEFIRNFDHIARRFGDQSVIERVVIAFYPTDQHGTGAPGDPIVGKWVEKNVADALRWYEGDVLHLNLTELDSTTLGALFQGGYNLVTGSSGTGLADVSISHFAPDYSVITDVLSIYHDDGHYTTPVEQRVEASLIEGLGTKHLTITLDANRRVVNGGDPISNPVDYAMVGYTDSAGTPHTDGSPRRIFVEVEITYPMGVGTTDTPNFPVLPDTTVYDGTDGRGLGPAIESDAGSQRPIDYEKLLAPRFRSGFREVHLEYVANDTRTVAGPAETNAPVGSVTDEFIVSRNQTTLYFPRRVYAEAAGTWSGQTRVTDATDSVDRAVDEASTEFGSSSRKVVLSVPLSGAGQTLSRIEYFAQDPLPNYGPSGGGYQVAVYYRASAPQTAGVKEGTLGTTVGGVLPTVLQVEPVAVGNPWTGQVGMGSTDLAYPYESPLEQLPIVDGSVTTREWFFCASANVSVDDFNANTGLLHLHPFVQADTQGVLTLGGVGVGQTPRVDAEFRALYPYSDVDAYRPTVMAQPLSGATRHKVFVPMLVRATEDSPGSQGGLLFRRNELLLVVLTRFAELDAENDIRFVDTDNRTGAAVYRTRNLLLIAGAKNI